MSTASRRTAISWRALQPILLVAVGLSAYVNSLSGDFLFDDVSAIVANPHLKHILPIRPRDRFVTDVTFKLNYVIGGLNAADHRATNVAIHLMAGLLLYGVMRRTLKLCPPPRGCIPGCTKWMPFVVAAIWLVHPLQTESVTYICQRYESLMGLFMLLTLYGFLRAQASARPRLWYDVSLGACLLGMGTKSVMVAAPFAMLCFDYVLVARTWKELWRKRGRYHIAMFLTLGVLAILVGRMVQAAGRQGTETVLHISPLTYLFTQFGVILHYLRLSVFPHPLCLDYAWPIAEGWCQILPQGMIVVALGAATLWGLHRRRAWGLAGAWFFLFLGPSSSIMPIADMAFEHRMYLPLISVIVLAVAAWCCIGRTWPRTIHVAALLVVVGALGVLTAMRNLDYGSKERMWRSVVAQRPQNYRQHVALITALIEQRRYDEAEAFSRLLVSRTGAALKVPRRRHVTHAANAERFHTVGLNQLGRVLLCKGELTAAAKSFERALQRTPNYKGARQNLAVTRYMQGHRAASLRLCRDLIEEFPRSVEPRVLAAQILAERGDFESAIHALEEAQVQSPLSLVVKTELAWTLATCPVDALRDAERALALAQELSATVGGASARASDILAVAYADLGHFDEAIRAATRALELARGKASGSKEDVLFRQGIEQRLNLYERGKPFRQPEGGDRSGLSAIENREDGDE